MLTYDDICCTLLTAQGWPLQRFVDVCSRMHTYAHVRSRILHLAHGTGMASTEFNILKVSPGSVLVDMHAPGTQFTCFTSIKVQILTTEELLMQIM